MLQDIIVTTPKNQMANAAAEAEDVVLGGGGYYFRTFRTEPRSAGVGSRIFYVEDGYIRGYAVVNEVVRGNMQCGTTGKNWGYGIHFVMDATSWTWIHPIVLSGFQGWRYFDASQFDIKKVGGWLDPRPLTP